MTQAIVMLAGWGHCRQVWRAIEEVFSECPLVITLELPGHGETPLSTWDETIDNLFASTPSGALWIAWSLGGNVATALAHRYPQHIDRLVLLASTPKWIQQASWTGMSSEAYSQFLQLAERDIRKAFARFFLLQWHDSGTPRAKIACDLSEVLEQHYAINDLTPTLSWLKDHDTSDCLSKLSMPVMHIFAEKDALVPIQVMKDLRESIPMHEYRMIKDASHCLLITHPIDVAIYIKQWILK